MSRTHKDVPRQVRLDRLPMTREDHHGCRHSLAGGTWRWRTEIVHHDAEWHLVTQWRISSHDEEGNFGQCWIDADDRDLTVFRTRQVWRYSAWDEKVLTIIWIVRKCDLEGGTDPGYPCSVEHYGTPAQDDRANLYRQGRRDDRPRRVESRRAVRNALRGAAAESNSPR